MSGALSAPPPPEAFLEIRSMVASEFTIIDSYLEFGVPTFITAPGPTKEPFKRLALKMKQQGYYPMLRKEAERHMIKITPKPFLKPPRLWINLVLFTAACGTILIDGYLQSSNPVFAKHLLNLTFTDTILQAVFYTGCILAIFGLHEVGHKVACEFNNMDASLPYFIPGIPGVLPTFGAVIMQREPPVNRDQLFDLGFTGPIVGFIILIFVTLLAFQTAFLVPESQALAWEQMGLIQYIPSPLLFYVIGEIIRPSPEGFVLFLSPIGRAAWLGAIVTFLNLMPAWQLDGGHIARATFGPKLHRAVSMVSVAILFLMGWWTMALFLVLFMGRGQHPGPLDDVSSLSKTRKLMTIVILGILISCAIIMW